MSAAADLRGFAKELRIVIDRSLDDAEILKGLREASTAKGIDWSQLKALVKAAAQDDRDGGTRIDKLIARAEFASAYADMLKMNEPGGTCSSSEDTQQSNSPDRSAFLGPLATDEFNLPDFLDRRAQAGA